MEPGEIGGLVELCIVAATRNRDSVEKWRRQRRTLERLPSPLGDALFRRLVRQRILFPSLLEVFQSCVESVDLKGDVSVDAEWMAYLGAFRYLRSLDLADCRTINNAALWPITGMTTLKELDLSRCMKITDAGVKHLLSNSNLEKLCVSETRLTSAGVMHFNSLGHLRILDLGGLPVTDEALRSLQVLKQLEDLDLWGSKISDEGASVLAMLPKLSSLNLAWTNVSVLPHLPSIACLNMSYCSISSMFNGENRHRPPLTRLMVSGATFVNMDEAFSHLPANILSFLDLSRSSLSNFQFLVDVKALQHLNLSHTGLTDGLIDPIMCAGENLRDLDLTNTKITSHGIANLAGHVPNLEKLSLSYTSVDDWSLSYIGMMPSLKMVDLGNTNIKGYIDLGQNNLNKEFSLTALQNLNNLESLNLEETRLGDKALLPLAALKELKFLSLKGDFISDTSLHVMSCLLNLRCLGFRGAVLTNSGLNSFKPPAMLHTLDLRGCWLLSEDDVSSYCRSYPLIEVKHELRSLPSNDQSVMVSSSSSLVKFPASQLGSGVEKSSPLSMCPKGSFADERIKYSREELLNLQLPPPSDTAHAAPDTA